MRTSVVFVSCLVLLLGACGDGGEGADGGAGTGAAGHGALRGRTFLSTDVEGHELVAGTELRITFNEDGTLGASAGCNQFVGELTVEEDVLVVTNLGGTEMGCDEERHAQDAWFTGLLSSRPTFVLDDDGALTITGGNTSIELLDREVADPDRALVGTRWTVDTLLQGAGPDGAASSLPPGVESWIELGGDGRFVGSDGCNDIAGRYEVDEQMMRVTELSGNDKECPAEVMAAADVVRQTLRPGDVTYEIRARRLTLTASNGAGVSATAAS